jgi:hypothetical protein
MGECQDAVRKRLMERWLAMKEEEKEERTLTMAEK